MKTKLIFEFIVDHEVFENSGSHNEFDDILFKPLRDHGYRVEEISTIFTKEDGRRTFEISIKG